MEVWLEPLSLSYCDDYKNWYVSSTWNTSQYTVCFRSECRLLFLSRLFTGPEEMRPPRWRSERNKGCRSQEEGGGLETGHVGGQPWETGLERQTHKVKNLLLFSYPKTVIPFKLSVMFNTVHHRPCLEQPQSAKLDLMPFKRKILFPKYAPY